MTSPTAFKRLMNFYLPFLGAGVSVDSINDNYTEINVSMPLRFYNKNVVGTHFGGSLYSMVDPFYMLMLMQHMGEDHYVWDKSATIDFIAPGKSRVFATFKLSLEQIDAFKVEASSGKAIYPEFMVPITGEDGKLVAKVNKTLYIRKKEH